MQSDPVQHLLNEHKEILAEFARLEKAVQALEEEGDAALADLLPIFQRVGQMMAGRLEQHARKEDEALFPAVEAVFGSASPTGAMRDEHREIHDQSRLFRETLRQLNEVEHPKIEAGGSRLRRLARDGDDLDALLTTAREILDLVAIHFDKEEQMLFPMVTNLLSTNEQASVTRKMEAIGAESR